MYKQDKSKITNFYNQFSNPSGRGPMPTNLGDFLGDKPTSIRDMVSGVQSPTVSNPNQPGLPQGTPSPTQILNQNLLDQRNQGAFRSTPAPQAPAPAQGGGQMFSPQQAPMGQPQQQGAPQGEDMTPYMRPDGSLMTPEEYVEKVKGEMQSRMGQGDIGTYAAGQFNDAEKTEEQLALEARQLGNARGDLASGEKDPWGIASESGVAYSPEELKAIENAAAGIYDPALTSAIGKLEAKKKADEREFERQLRAEEAEKDFERDLMKMEQQFKYSTALKKMDIDVNTAAAAEKRFIEQSEKDAEVRDAQIGTVALLNTLLSPTTNLNAIAGGRIGNFLTGSWRNTNAQARAQVAQLKAMTSMDEREKLRGSGSVSNFEQQMLSDSANAINHAIQEDGSVRMNQDTFKQELKNLRGVAVLKAGVPSASVTVTDPGTGERVTGEIGRQELEDLHLQGYLIDFN